MKNRKIVLLFPLLLIAAGVLISAWLYRMQPGDSNDVVLMNRIAREAALHWNELINGQNAVADGQNAAADGQSAAADGQSAAADGEPEFENAFFQTVPQPFCITDRQGNILYRSGEEAVTTVAQALRKGYPVLEVETGEAVVGRVIVTANQEQELLVFRRAVTAVLLLFSILCMAFSCGYYFYLESRIVRPFEELKQFASRISQGDLDLPLPMNKNNLFGAFTESFDIMREQLMTARKREMEANSNQKELVASLSHDIKTPVTSIKLTSELLMELEPDQRLRGKIGMIYQKAGQIEELVNNLFHTTLQDMEHLTVAPCEVYSSALTRLLREADYKGRAVLPKIPSCMLWMDELRLSQVLSNLFINSYKYADTSVKVDADLEDTCLKLSLRDTGKGIPQEELPLIFNRFYRGSNAAGESGSGLGLYICRQIMEQMRGDIYAVCSEAGFTIVLILRLV